jgi:hypothetical protein
MPKRPFETSGGEIREMTSQPGTGQPGQLAGYLGAMNADGAPLLGHLVLYSVFEGKVTPAQLAAWFRELFLDAAFLRAPVRWCPPRAGKRFPARASCVSSRRFPIVFPAVFPAAVIAVPAVPTTATAARAALSALG